MRISDADKKKYIFIRKMALSNRVCEEWNRLGDGIVSAGTVNVFNVFNVFKKRVKNLVFMAMMPIFLSLYVAPPMTNCSTKSWKTPIIFSTGSSQKLKPPNIVCAPESTGLYCLPKTTETFSIEFYLKTFSNTLCFIVSRYSFIQNIMTFYLTLCYLFLFVCTMFAACQIFSIKE